MRRLLRSLRRRTTLECTVVADIVAIEFRTKSGAVDLRASVYEVCSDQTMLVRVHAEHYASAGLAPARGSHADLSGLLGREPVKTPGTSLFSFTRERHRELDLRDEHELHEVVQRLIERMRERRVEIRMDELREFLRERIANKDEEWRCFFQGAQGERWLRFAGVTVRLPHDTCS